MDNMITLPYAIDADRPDREIRPFAGNAEFLDEKFREYVLLAERSVLMGKARRAGNETGGNGNGGTPKEQPFAELMRKTAEYETTRKRNGERLLVSGDCSLPFETLARNCGLDDTARHILWILFFRAVALDFEGVSTGLAEADDLMSREKDFRARDVVRVLAPGSLDEQMKTARYFGVESPLIKHHLIETYSFGAQTFLDIEVSIPMRVAKYIADDDTEYDLNSAFLVERPEVPLSFVVLPEDQKERITTFIENYEASLRRQEEAGLDRVLTYGRSLAILLYGPPGTGKTLLAKAIATHTKRPLVSMRSSQTSSSSGRWFDHHVGEDDIEELFREARMRGGIVFLDECEQFCSKNNSRHYAVLREIEHTDSIVIMTTNVPQELSEAFDRRIALKIPFRIPDVSLRRQIWEKHLPETVSLDPAVDLDIFARKYQLSGGYIKNAVMSAVNLASSRSRSGAFMVIAEDLDEGADLQQKHLGSLSGLIQHALPDRGIDSLALPAETKSLVEGIIRTALNYRKLTRHIRFINSSANMGYKILFSGPSFASAMDSVEAIARELDTGICMVPFNKLLLNNQDFEKGCNDLIKARALEISSIAHATGQLLVLVDRDGNMGTFEQDDLRSAAEFLSHFREYDGIMFMVSSARDPKAILRQIFQYSIFFDVISSPERLRCWERVTEGVDLADDIDLGKIADEYKFGPEEIQNALYAACLVSGIESAGEKIDNRILKKGIRSVLNEKAGAEPLFGTDGGEGV